MHNVIVAEICSLVTLGIIAFGVATRNYAKLDMTKKFLILLICGIISLLVDIFSYQMGEAIAVTLPGRFIISLSYCAGGLMVIPFAYYVHAVFVRTRPMSIWFVHSVSIVLICNCLYVLYLGLTGQLFSLEPGHMGQGTFPLIPLAVIYGSILYILITGAFVANRTQVRSLLILSVYLTLPIISGALSSLGKSVNDYSLVTGAFSLVFVYVGLQNRLNDELVAEHRSALMQARLDTLTKISNRYVGSEVVDQRIVERKPFAMMLLDVDSFKQINDTYGHPTGDQVLMSIANVLKNTMADGIPVRMGGDEFMFIIGHRTSEAEITSFMEKLFEQVDNIRIPGMCPTCRISVSVGIAFYEGESNVTFNDLYHISDQRLYNSKKQKGCSYTAS